MQIRKSMQRHVADHIAANHNKVCFDSVLESAEHGCRAELAVDPLIGDAHLVAQLRDKKHRLDSILHSLHVHARNNHNHRLEPHFEQALDLVRDQRTIRNR
eukprot:Amastigsp_a4144_23.p6 type:complete len:101 gc:universal Amastigsp_a4144_23:1278-1580(+)